MIRIDAIVPQNDIRAISDALKKIHVGGITVMKVRGRGKTVGPALHAAKGTETFIPEFTDKFIVTVIVEDKDENETVNIIRSHTKIGKIFMYKLSRAVDIATGAENEQAI
ncbi:Nitrogen regulatory protein P-II [Nitrosotalea sinensis]|uniref:Nitrogen regulatory protein P-II n=1 Tax=Nitrosotalea sinensis TaxID=1499975 RepID=A0A2H1EHY0_9ARCH|nr:P-II family nitrogen regulator [Candidatus Nitrosotalea sinensis]SHO46512.1 Nitrogen regulatory protein P-II [Candidatus Nitrosotalea sinensis]